jgi:hypothetical protein
MDAAGTDPEWARDLPERLGKVGLVAVDAEIDGQLFHGGSDPARFWSLTWHQTRDRALALDVPDEVIESGGPCSRTPTASGESRQGARRGDE